MSQPMVLNDNERKVIEALRELRKRKEPTTLLVLDQDGRGWYRLVVGEPYPHGRPIRVK